MKSTSLIGGVVVMSLALVVAGCGEKQKATASAPAPAAASEAKPAAAPVEAAASKAVAEPVAQAKAMLADLKVPDLKAASEMQLANTSSEALTNLATVAGPSQPEVAKQVEAVKSSLSQNKAVDALAQVKQLAVSAQAIPGAPAVIESTKQMVSAWALKQGFDTAKISPVLGALQSRDLAGLGSQVATLLGAGGLTDEQKSLLNGVLSTYGIDAQASDLLGKAKGLLGN